MSSPEETTEEVKLVIPAALPSSLPLSGLLCDGSVLGDFDPAGRSPEGTISTLALDLEDKGTSVGTSFSRLLSWTTLMEREFLSQSRN